MMLADVFVLTGDFNTVKKPLLTGVHGGYKFCKFSEVVYPTASKPMQKRIANIANHFLNKTCS